jgi:hypothetical protein
MVFLTRILAAGILLIGSALQAEDPPAFSPDRPGEANPAALVPPGYSQIEVGWTHTGNKENGVKSSIDTFPETLYRYGLSDCLELRLESPVHAWEEAKFTDGSPSEHLRGWGDTAAGIKLNLWQENAACCLPAAALLGRFSLPTGAHDQTSGRADPSVELLFSNTLSETFTLDTNLGAVWETSRDDAGDKDTLSSFLYAESLTMNLTGKLAAFAEVFAWLPLSAKGTPSTTVDAGLTYLLTDTLQVDISAGRGLSRAADDWFVGMGVAYRFPK